MNYPIVQIETKDKIWLDGLFLESESKDQIFIHTHGTASNFYEEHFVQVISEYFLERDISVLFVNNRGVGVYDPYQKIGCAVEKFEDCLIDIDAWIEFAIDRGYKKILLSGHSLGTEKAVYYAAKGQYRGKIEKLVLLAPATSPGSEPKLIGEDKLKKLITEARDMVKRGEGESFLPRYTYGGLLPKTANSFLNFMQPDSEISKALPFHLGKLELFGTISIPILAVISDDPDEEYTVIPIKEAMDLMKAENPNVQTQIINGTNHSFEGKESDLSQILFDFIEEALAK